MIKALEIARNNKIPRLNHSPHSIIIMYRHILFILKLFWITLNTLIKKQTHNRTKVPELMRLPKMGFSQ